MNQHRHIEPVERHGDWMQTATGIQFWPLDPRPEEILIEDIAHALSNMCRYAGHCRYFYSVAQHSVLVSHLVPAEDALWGLLHDATEAYLVDVPRPVKPHLDNYKPLEAQLMSAVCRKFDLPQEMPQSVHHADTAILADEKLVLMPEEPASWHLPYPPTGIAIEPWEPSQARQRFLHRFSQLT